MNDRIIIIGQEYNGKSFNARYANDLVVYVRDTPEEAVKALLSNRYPMIWYDFEGRVIVDGIGELPSEYIDKESKELICEYPRFSLREIKDAINDLGESDVKRILKKLSRSDD